MLSAVLKIRVSVVRFRLWPPPPICETHDFSAITGGLSVHIHAENGPTIGLPGYNGVVRFDGSSGAFIDIFVTPGSGGLNGNGKAMIFVDSGCARYGDYGFANRCFTGAPKP